MALQYVTNVASKANPWRTEDPVLNEEDEAFLQRVTSNPSTTEGELLPVKPTPMGRDAQIALMNGAQEISLPLSPTEDLDRQMPADAVDETKENEETKEVKTEAKTPSDEKAKKKNRPWNWMRKASADTRKKQQKDQKQKEQEAAAASLSEIVTKTKTVDGETISDRERRQEQEEMAAVLEQLNLAAENNRVFSISDETQELLHKFKLVFKDLVTGVPTAYHDLELLLTNGDKQLKDTFGHLPSFLKKLVEQLPNRMTESLAPELLAVAGEKASQGGLNMENAGKAASAAHKMGFKTPSLKELVGKPTALVGMLRSVTAFLRARFPAVLGMNVLWSVALFIVLLVLWYCHKRGKEVRLENERLVTEAEIAKMNEEYTEQIRVTETLSTTAPKDAPIEQVKEGVQEVQTAREEALKADLEKAVAENEATETDSSTPAALAEPVASTPQPLPTAAAATTTESADTPSHANPANKSTLQRFSIFRSLSKRNSGSNVRPYPGT